MLGILREFNRKRKFGPAVIVVSGLPRSGTSMMMKMLDAGGLELVTDRVRTADEDNPKGYFEDERVKNLENADDKSWLRDCKGKVVKIISFLLKDLPDDIFYKVVFMRRNLEEVIASQNKMLLRRGESTDEAGDERMIERYRKHLRKVEFDLRGRGNFDLLMVDYREALDEPREQAERVGSFLRTKLDVEKMTAAVDPRLYRNRR